MKSPIFKRSIVINGHKTSVSLEDAFWSDLKRMAAEENRSLSELISSIDDGRQQANLSSALRVFVLAQYQAMAVRAGQLRNVAEHQEAESVGGLVAAATRDEPPPRAKTVSS